MFLNNSSGSISVGRARIAIPTSVGSAHPVTVALGCIPPAGAATDVAGTMVIAATTVIRMFAIDSSLREFLVRMGARMGMGARMRLSGHAEMFAATTLGR
jgi:hypothetical protein